MTCRRCGGPITDAYCDDCGLLARHPPVLASQPARPEASITRRREPVVPTRAVPGPAEPSISRNGWAPRAAAARAPRFITRPVLRLTLVGIVVLLAGLGWFAVRSPNAPAQSDLTAWKVGACVRIATAGNTWPVRCDTANDGMIVRQVERSGECPASAQWWVARETDGFCVRRDGPPVD